MSVRGQVTMIDANKAYNDDVIEDLAARGRSASPASHAQEEREKSVVTLTLFCPKLAS